jgi:uncharacterized protein YeaC (DUF1315 family)
MAQHSRYDEVIRSLTPEVYRRLLAAVETGKWADGRPLSEAQREHTLQAVIAWGELHLPPEERVGHIERGHKAVGAVQPLRWRDGQGAAE